MEEKGQQRLRGLVERTMDLMEQSLEALADPENRGRAADTKSLKEIISALKELKTLLQEEGPREEAFRVIFEAGEEAFNE